LKEEITAIIIRIYKFSTTGIIHLKTIVKCLTALLILQESDCCTPTFKLSLLPQV
jgi:hypothetical protein